MHGNALFEKSNSEMFWPFNPLVAAVLCNLSWHSGKDRQALPQT